MPHRCVRCGSMFADGAQEILKGCTCGSRLFFFVRQKDKKAEEVLDNLSIDEKKQIEKDVYDIAGIDKKDDTPVVLDLESINITKPGKFEIDLVNLFNKKNPLIYKLEEGKYIIDLAESFKRNKQ
jgi:uncharacterized protein